MYIKQVRWYIKPVIFVPKITGIGQVLLKLSLVVGWYPFLRQCSIYTVSQRNVPHLACYNTDAHEWILIFFGGNVTDKVGNQKTLYYITSNNLLLHYLPER